MSHLGLHYGRLFSHDTLSLQQKNPIHKHEACHLEHPIIPLWKKRNFLHQLIYSPKTPNWTLSSSVSLRRTCLHSSCIVTLPIHARSVQSFGTRGSQAITMPLVIPLTVSICQKRLHLRHKLCQRLLYRRRTRVEHHLVR